MNEPNEPNEPRPLPFEPESRESIKARFAAALGPEVDVKRVAAGKEPLISHDRRHVFDYEDGYRLIASTDKDDFRCRMVHLSFGIAEHHGQTRQDLLDTARERAKELVGDIIPVQDFLSLRAYHLFFNPDDLHP